MEIERLTGDSRRRIEKYIEVVSNEKLAKIREYSREWVNQERKARENSVEFKELKAEARQINKQINAFIRKCDKSKIGYVVLNTYGKDKGVSVSLKNVSNEEYPNINKLRNQIKQMQRDITKSIIFKDIPKLQKAIEKLESL